MTFIIGGHPRAYIWFPEQSRWSKEYLVKIFLLITFNYTLAFAQDIEIKRPYISSIDIFGGPNVSIAKGNYFDALYGVPKYGYMFGVSLSHNITQRLFISGTLMWEAKGSKTEYEYTNNSLTPPQVEKLIVSVSPRYGTFTLLPAFRLGLKPNIAVGLGPYFSLLGSVKTEAWLYRNAEPISYSYSVDDGDRRSYDYGLAVQLRYQIPLTEKWALCIQSFGNFGLVNITNPDLPLLEERNESFSITIGATLLR